MGNPPITQVYITDDPPKITSLSVSAASPTSGEVIAAGPAWSSRPHHIDFFWHISRPGHVEYVHPKRTD